MSNNKIIDVNGNVYANSLFTDSLLYSDGTPWLASSNTKIGKKLSYGIKLGARTERQAEQIANSIQEQIVGYAAYAETSGGAGKTLYRVESVSLDPTVENSWAWAIASAKAAGGGIIYFDPRGHFDLIFTSDQRIDFDNLTIIAPGRNVTFWFNPMVAGMVYLAKNIITAFIEFRTLPGLLAQSYTSQICTISISNPAIITLVNHGFTPGTSVVFSVSSGGSLPTGIVSGARYYVISDGFTADHFEISDSIGGTAIATSGSSSGTSSVIRYSKNEHKLVNVAPQQSDKIAFVGCDFRHASDGACDIAYSGLDSTSAPCRVTVQDCIFWDTDQPMLVGGSHGTGLEDPTVVFLTLYRSIFAYCGQRQPKIQGFAFVDMVDCYTLTQPYQRDQSAPTNEFSVCYGAGVVTGGKIAARGCLWTTTVGTGYNATYLIDPMGAIKVQDCAVENDMIIETANESYIPAVPYYLPHAGVPGNPEARNSWISSTWQHAGAKVDSAPEGEFIWTAETSAYPNGETVLVDRYLGGRWCRVDAQVEYKTLGQQSVAVPGIASGQYNPTVSSLLNLVSTPIIQKAVYTQIGNYVTVTGTLTATTSASGDTQFTVSLPIASTITTNDVSGSIIAYSSSTISGGAVIGHAADDSAFFRFYSGSTTERTYTFTFTYEIL